MRPYIVLLIAWAPMNGLQLLAQNPQDRHERAVAAITRLGGSVLIYDKEPGKPVTVVLTGSSSPGDCMSYLKDITNLHGLDL